MQITESHKKANKVRIKLEALYRELISGIYKELMAFIGEFEFDEYRRPAYYTGASNLDLLLDKIDNMVGGIVDVEIAMMREHLEEIYGDINDDYVSREKALSEKWSGFNYEDNLRENNHRLAISLRREITSALTRQDNKKQLKELLDKIKKTSSNGAIKILVTETTYANNVALIDSFNRAGYTKYMYVARLDDRTCGKCSSLHRQVFDIEEAIAGVNLPPLHSNCRCTIIEIK